MSKKVKIAAYLEGFRVTDGTDIAKYTPSPGLPILELCGFELCPVMKTSYMDGDESETELIRDLSADDYIAIKEIIETSQLVPPTDTKNELDSLISCLRIYKGGFVEAKKALVKIPFSEEDERTINFFMGSSPRDLLGGPIYAIFDNEVDELKLFVEKVFPTVLRAFADERGDLVIRFFNRSIDDLVKNDFKMAIAYMISSLEAMLSTDSHELTHRLSQSVAILAENDPGRRKIVYRKMKKLYNIRSKVVHGEGYSDDYMKLLDCTFKLERIVRHCLKVYLSYLINQKENLPGLSLTLSEM